MDPEKSLLMHYFSHIQMEWTQPVLYNQAFPLDIKTPSLYFFNTEEEKEEGEGENKRIFLPLKTEQGQIIPAKTLTRGPKNWTEYNEKHSRNLTSGKIAWCASLSASLRHHEISQGQSCWNRVLYIIRFLIQLKIGSFLLIKKKIHGLVLIGNIHLGEVPASAGKADTSEPP